MLNPVKTLERKLLASTDSIDNAVRRTLGLPETVRADSLRGRRVLNALKVLEEEAKNNGQLNMKKLYKQASDELNKALLKRRQSHQMAETFASPGLVYGGALGLGSLIPRSLGAYARLKPLLVEGRDPSTGEERKANVLHTGADIMQGTALASVAAELAAPIVAAITPTRTAEEQTKADKSDPWKSWLIPGVASYNKWKRLGRALHSAAQKKTASAVAPTNEELKKIDLKATREAIQKILKEKYSGDKETKKAVSAYKKESGI